MVIPSSKQYGISLVELMITITILAILVIAGTSLTVLWSKQAELDKAAMSLKSAMNMAKSLAMRNEFAKNENEPASQLCFNKNTNILEVRKAPSPSNSIASCDSTIVFSYSINQAIEIKNVNLSDFNCFNFNHFGQVVAGTTCQTNLLLTISNGSLNEKIDLN